MESPVGSELSHQDIEIVSGSTFDDRPFTIALERDQAIDIGASASIYKGTIDIGRPFVVAVKVFGRIRSRVQQELLIRELRAARLVSLTHPSILAFLGTADVGAQTAIVSLYMRNGNLIEYIRANTRGCDKTKLLRQVAEAVNFLHTTTNLVHGDIKGANVLISDFGNALLADFGLSTFIEQNQSALTTMTAIRDMYTLRFAAPELITGDTPAGSVSSESSCSPTSESEQANCTTQRSKTRESDVYAYGMLILEVVTENPPWHGLRHAAVVLRVSTGQHPPRPMDGALVSMSHAAWELCLNCWRTDPAERIKMVEVLEVFQTEGFNIHPVKTLGKFAFMDPVAYMADGRHVVLGTWAGVVYIADTLTGIARPMQGLASRISCVAASPDGLQVASGSRDSSICRWDVASGELVGEPVYLKAVPCCLTYSPTGRYLACGEGQCVRLWHADSDDRAGYALAGHSFRVKCIAFSPDGAHLVSASSDGTVLVWDVDTRAIVSTLKLDHWADSIALSPNGARLATGSSQALQIWDISSGRFEIELDAYPSHARALAFSPAGDCVSGSIAGTICIWDVQTGQVIGSWEGARENGANSVCFSPDGRSLVAGVDGGGGILIWDLFA